MAAGAPPVFNLFIINKSGGLIYYKDFGSLNRLDTNDSLRLASTWHGLHAIAMQLSPIPNGGGIEMLEAGTFDLHCFQTLTGTKFFIATEVGFTGAPTLLAIIYDLYTDYVLKNPFYEVEMPIRCDLFDLHLPAAIRKDRSLLAAGVVVPGRS
ncbi:unnamed protein product [Closterium sp. NIES-64]|nr:unnamed protein product [Closterium sp. NIES-64]CAI5947928.1 unnamed protein product [Closterium sp. NIES-65]